MRSAMEWLAAQICDGAAALPPPARANCRIERLNADIDRVLIALIAHPNGTDADTLARDLGMPRRRIYAVICEAIRRGDLVEAAPRTGPKLGNRPRVLRSATRSCEQIGKT